MIDGSAEESAIRGQLAGLAGDRLLDAQPDEGSVPVDATGKARPYIVLDMGTPFRKGNDRSFGDGEQDIPYYLTFAIGCYAGDRNSANMLYKEVAGRLAGWTPVPDDDTPIEIPYAFPDNTRGTQVRPATFGKVAAMRCTINT